MKRKATEGIIEIGQAVIKPVVEVTTIKPKSWWPICFLCKKVVDNLVLQEPTGERDIYQKELRRYYSVCHNRTEWSYVGIDACKEYERSGRRLPDAFKGHTYEQNSNVETKQLE